MLKMKIYLVNSNIFRTFALENKGRKDFFMNFYTKHNTDYETH